MIRESGGKFLLVVHHRAKGRDEHNVKNSVTVWGLTRIVSFPQESTDTEKKGGNGACKS